jgi:hypothetical protein
MSMQSFTLTVFESRDIVFNFLANIENLPKWAGGYCEHITLLRDRWWALTADGEQVVEIETRVDTGVIDLLAGTAPERMTSTPIRVSALSDHRTHISLTLFEVPGQEPESFARRCEIFQEAVKGLLARFGGGELHDAGQLPQMAESELS